jgi:UDP-glucose-4-epimerase GalE
MNVLVTGGAGYIGSHTCKALAGEGFLPVTFDNLCAGHEWAVQWGPLVRGDLKNADLLRTTIRKYEICAVLHFAAYSNVGESVGEPQKYYRNNLMNTLALLDAMIETGVQTVVFSSTCATFGIPQGGVLDETHPQNPVNPYGETKLAIERALRWYGSAYGIRSVCLRYFNAAGADAEGQIGEDHNPETHLIPLILEAALDQNRSISIFGTDYDTPDGTAIRDYIHVTDLASAHVKALRFLQSGGDSASFNLGTGQGYSVRDVISAVRRVTGRHPRVIETGRRAGDPPRLVAASQLANGELQWIPRHSSLDNIIETAWNWRRGVVPSTGRLQTVGASI